MTTLREAAQMAYAVPLHELLATVPRDARLVIEDADGKGTRFIPVGRYCHEAAEALRAALAQSEQEPVAWMFPDDLERFQTSETFAQAFSVACGSPTQGKTLPLYTAPPQRERQGLTDEEYATLMQQADYDAAKTGSVFQNLRRAIEAKLREKNT